MKLEVLQLLIDQGLSTYGIAEQVGKSQTTVRYWLKKYDLTTVQSSDNSTKCCPRCKETKSIEDFYNRRGKKGGSVYCKPCTTLQTLERQRDTKQKAVDYVGGSCMRCGYNKCLGALHFHHIDPNEKDPNWAQFKFRSFNDKFKEELDKCELLCANCHLEEHTNYCS